MLAPYSPTYTFSDLVRSIGDSSDPDLEQELCSRLGDLFGIKFVHLFSTARAALYYLLRAYDRPGGVIIPSFTCITVPEALRFAGYYPEFVDISYPSLDIDLGRLPEAIRPGVTVVLGIHSFGLPCDIQEIKRIAHQKDLLLVEDAAPALGATYHKRIVGSFGDASLLSFNHGKVVSGEAGGAILTNSSELEEKLCRLSRAHPNSVTLSLSFVKAFLIKLVTNRWLYPIKAGLQKENYPEVMVRGVSPLDDMPKLYSENCSRLSISLILQQLGRLDANITRRARIGEIYQERLSGLPWLTMPLIPADCSPAWVQFPVFVRSKIAFYRYMRRHGIDMSMNYPYSVAESFGRRDMVNGRRVVDTILGFPSYPSLSDSQVHAICDVAARYPG